MESKRSKCRGFIKSKLAKSFNRETKPSIATAMQPLSSKPTKPIPFNHQQRMTPPSSTTAGYIIVNQDQVFPQPNKPKLAFVVPATDRNRDYYYGAKLENFYAGDEAVDVEAAKYISRVQERFRLEQYGNWDLGMQ
ncbi:hypothetical protein BUALT_Bualt04G0174900 [Buddleja alternifolia]|uniref:Uncharacterized protein n=1 Tax=Buddleja alternifolia TaxID=168488 RepID=A0AAV6Y0M3_9LAMI|nr:hypothetical protein BUALT_Bualt04G0174900 [Buddleja alternifolia]